MPTIKEFKEIVKVTPIEQAIMVEGPHGIGKSEILKQSYVGMGYKVIILFLRGVCFIIQKTFNSDVKIRVNAFKYKSTKVHCRV